MNIRALYTQNPLRFQRMLEHIMSTRFKSVKFFLQNKSGSYITLGGTIGDTNQQGVFYDSLTDWYNTSNNTDHPLKNIEIFREIHISKQVTLYKLLTEIVNIKEISEFNDFKYRSNELYYFLYQKVRHMDSKHRWNRDYKYKVEWNDSVYFVQFKRILTDAKDANVMKFLSAFESRTGLGSFAVHNPSSDEKYFIHTGLQTETETPVQPSLLGIQPAPAPAPAPVPAPAPAPAPAPVPASVEPQVESNVSEMEAMLATHESHIQTQETTLATYESRMQQMEAKMQSQETIMATYQSRMQIMEAKMQSQETMLAAHESRMQQMQDQIIGLLSSVTFLKTETNELRVRNLNYDSIIQHHGGMIVNLAQNFAQKMSIQQQPIHVIPVVPQQPQFHPPQRMNA